MIKLIHELSKILGVRYISHIGNSIQITIDRKKLGYGVMNPYGGYRSYTAASLEARIKKILILNKYKTTGWSCSSDTIWIGVEEDGQNSK